MMKFELIDREDYISELIIGHLNNDLSSDQQRDLDDWRNQSQEHEQAFNQLARKESLHELIARRQEVPVSVHLQNVYTKIEKSKRKLSTSRRWLYLAAAAAIISALLLVRLPRPKAPDLANRIQKDVAPATQKAKLILDNGEEVELAANKDSSFAMNQLQFKVQQGTLSYKDAQNIHSNVFLKTPKGGNYHVTLDDGTNVWLNSSSSIRFPTHFTGSREVSVTGEVYFEVAKNADKPFIVHEGNRRIIVLGTSFNIRSYPEEVWQTSLVEGAVKVETDDKNYILNPGKAAVITTDGKTRVVVADLLAVTAWKNGLFIFNNSSLKDVASELSRWYDVEIRFTDGVGESAKFFKGEVERNVPISQVLELIEMTGIAKFTIKDRVITASPY
ncbi:FecR family protein [Chitinophaga defluvii]|uniref:FecR domain-containing protein n=1 Tax=Chitinophaga defluvii TaxID=3163343 RepID=A0ABV2T8P3_9BACT